MPRTCTNSCILKSRIRPPNLSRNSRAAAYPRIGTSQIEAMTALRTRVANFSTSPTSLDNINFHRTRTINSRSRQRRFRRRQTGRGWGWKEIVDGFLRERRKYDAETRTVLLLVAGGILYSNVTTRILSPTNPLVFWTVANTCVTAESQITLYSVNRCSSYIETNVFNFGDRVFNWWSEWFIPGDIRGNYFFII